MNAADIYNLGKTASFKIAGSETKDDSETYFTHVSTELNRPLNLNSFPVK